MRKRHGRILAIILALCMIVSAQSFAFAAVVRTFSSPTTGGFKVVEQGGAPEQLVKNVTIQMISAEGSIMGETVCKDGQNFVMENVGVGKIKEFIFSAAGYETTIVLVDTIAGKQYFSQSGDIAKFAKPALIEMKTDVKGIHTLSGTITVNDKGGNQISDAVMYLVDTADGNKVKYKKELDAEGKFEITNIAPGNYGWMISADGYKTSEVQTVGLEDLTADTEKKVTLIQSVSLIKKATIAGNVTDENKTPIANASVQLKKGTASVGATIKTDEDGNYIINNVDAGTYTLEVSAKGYDTLVSEAFTVSDSEPVTGKNFSLEQTVLFTAGGTLVDMNNNPITVKEPYLMIYFENPSKNINGSGYAYPDSDGQFSINRHWNYDIDKDGKYPTGTYNIRVMAHTSGYLNYETTITITKEDVKDGTYTIDPIKLVKGAAISGKVYDAETGETIAGTIGLDKDGSSYAVKIPDATAETGYAIIGLDKGFYEVKASAPGYTGSKSALIDFKEITGQEVNGVDLYLGKTGTGAILSGKVMVIDNNKPGENAKPAGSNIKAILMQGDQVVAETNCMENGNYVFKNLDIPEPDGSVEAVPYKVVAKADGYIEGESQPITLNKNESLGGNNITVYKKVVLERIEITKLPDKVVYENGEDTLDTTGMEVTAYYSNGTSRVLTDDEYMLSGYGLTTGENIIGITYTDDGVNQETLLIVTVKAPGVSGAPGDNGGGSDSGNDDGAIVQDKVGAANPDNAAKTGDDMNLGALFAIMALCGLVAAGTILTRKRSEASK